MKIRLYILFVLYGLLANGQVTQSNLLPEDYFKLNNKNKQNLIIELGNRYDNSLILDIVYRTEIVNFLIDTVITNDEINSTLASKILLQYLRLNEINTEQKEKLLKIYMNKSFNVYLTQLIGLVGDNMFVETLNNIYLNNAKNLKKYERETLLNTLARLGHIDAILNKLNYFKAEYNQKSMTLNQEYADQLKNINYINRKEIYDLLFEFIENDKNKTITIGSYGGDPYGADDNIYCTLSSFSAEILSQVIIGFPLNRVICSKDPKEGDLKIIQTWYKDNMNYKFKKWHPYYGINYAYWP